MRADFPEGVARERSSRGADGGMERGKTLHGDGGISGYLVGMFRASFIGLLRSGLNNPRGTPGMTG